MHYYDDLISLFSSCFESKWQTKLVRGDTEPLYIPAHDAQPYHAICFAHGYFSSALHEVSHWLIAGSVRRQQVDYGYWYMPDGRTTEQQRLFQQVEVKPQALEWILSQAAGYRFHVSLDNLNGSNEEIAMFKKAIYDQVIAYCEEGLPVRARLFRQALVGFYNTSQALKPEHFRLESL